MQIPTRRQIFSRQPRSIAKCENYRHYPRKFLSLPLIAKANAQPKLFNDGSKGTPPTVLLTQPSSSTDNGIVKSHTLPDINGLGRKSPVETTSDDDEDADNDDDEDDVDIEQQYVDEQSDDADAVLHVFDDEPTHELQMKPSLTGASHKDEPVLTQRFDSNQFKKYANIRSDSLDSDIIIGLFEGNIDSSDGEYKPAQVQSRSAKVSAETLADQSTSVTVAEIASPPHILTTDSTKQQIDETDEKPISTITKTPISRTSLTTPPSPMPANSETNNPEILAVTQEVDNRYIDSYI